MPKYGNTNALAKNKEWITTEAGVPIQFVILTEVFLRLSFMRSY
jgi:hypothetical protein